MGEKKRRKNCIEEMNQNLIGISCDFIYKINIWEKINNW